MPIELTLFICLIGLKMAMTGTFWITHLQSLIERRAILDTGFRLSKVMGLEDLDLVFWKARVAGIRRDTLLYRTALEFRCNRAGIVRFVKTTLVADALFTFSMSCLFAVYVYYIE